MPDNTSTDGSANTPAAPGDTDVIAMAEAERDAGVPDMQTAQAAADAKARGADDGEAEAHPS